jgi:hypothetical protein
MEQTLSFHQSAGSDGQNEEANFTNLRSRPFQCFIEELGGLEQINATEDYEDYSDLE